MLNRTSRPCLVLAVLTAILAAGCKRESTDNAQPGSPPANATSPRGGAPVAAQGNLEAANCTHVAGWAMDAKQPDVAITVDVFDGTTLLGTVKADIFRQDLVDAKRGNGKHGFTYVVPASLKDGKPHSIRVRVTGAAEDLPNGPKTITCDAPERE